MITHSEGRLDAICFPKFHNSLDMSFKCYVTTMTRKQNTTNKSTVRQITTYYLMMSPDFISKGRNPFPVSVIFSVSIKANKMSYITTLAFVLREVREVPIPVGSILLLTPLPLSLPLALVAYLLSRGKLRNRQIVAFVFNNFLT